MNIWKQNFNRKNSSFRLIFNLYILIFICANKIYINGILTISFIRICEKFFLLFKIFYLTELVLVWLKTKFTAFAVKYSYIIMKANVLLGCLLKLSDKLLNILFTFLLLSILLNKFNLINFYLFTWHNIENW